MQDKKLLFAILILVSASVLTIISIFDRENQVCFRGYCFEIELAQTPDEINRGLMFRQNLPVDAGMLFIFQQSANYPFWMKNTLLPLDIIWLSRDKKVVYIKKNAQPCLKITCQLIHPNRKAKYVLELNAGMVDEIGLKIGDRIDF